MKASRQLNRTDRIAFSLRREDQSRPIEFERRERDHSAGQGEGTDSLAFLKSYEVAPISPACVPLLFVVGRPLGTVVVMAVGRVGKTQADCFQRTVGMPTLMRVVAAAPKHGVGEDNRCR